MEWPGAETCLDGCRFWEQDSRTGLAGRAEQWISVNWQPDPIKMPGLFWVACGKRGLGEGEPGIGTPNSPSTPSSAPGLLSTIDPSVVSRLWPTAQSEGWLCIHAPLPTETCTNSQHVLRRP